jgi:hypothetical protein
MENNHVLPKQALANFKAEVKAARHTLMTTLEQGSAKTCVLDACNQFTETIGIGVKRVSFHLIKDDCGGSDQNEFYRTTVDLEDILIDE